MSTATPAEIACWLRARADLLTQARPAPLTVHLSLRTNEYNTSLSEAERILAVDGVASALGMTAHPSELASFWEHKAQHHDGPHLLSVSTGIAGPRLCACGAACTHHSSFSG